MISFKGICALCRSGSFALTKIKHRWLCPECARKNDKLPKGHLTAERHGSRIVIAARPSQGEDKAAFIARVMRAFNAVNK